MRYHIAAFAIAALLMGSVLAACGQDVAQGEKVATGPCVQCHSNHHHGQPRRRDRHAGPHGANRPERQRIDPALLRSQPLTKQQQPRRRTDATNTPAASAALSIQ